MTANLPRNSHYTPQFYLRNFAIDPEQKKIAAVTKHGSRAVWAVRSIEGTGLHKEIYVHMQRGVPVSVETAINRGIETPISQSDTWAKIASGRADALDSSDKPILYALIRHLEARTPHYLATAKELAHLAASSDSGMPFTDEEREMYAFLRANPNNHSAMFNMMAAYTEWTAENFASAALSIYRSPISLRTTTTPVMAVSAPPDPALHLPLPGMVPYVRVLTLNRSTIACLVMGDFDGAFTNHEIDAVTASGFNRNFVGQFSHFDAVQHLITDRDGLVLDMIWAPYDLVEENQRRIIFKRRGSSEP